MILVAPKVVRAQESQPAPRLCFAVADGYIDDQGVEQNGEDTLAFLNLETGDTQPVNGVFPNTETSFIESIAFAPGGSPLYAADASRLGTLDVNTGAFTAVGGGFGTGQGQLDGDAELESQAFDDVDSLSFNPLNGELWGVTHILGGPEALFKIDPATGQFVPQVFEDPNNPGQMVDFVLVQPIGDLDDIDDIAIDPVDGTMYAIMNRGGGSSKLVTIDPQNGNTTEIGFFTRQAAEPIIEDMEGLSFDNHAQLYGSTGNDGKDRNLLWQIDKTNAVADLVGQFDDRLIDIEALDCLSGSGFVVVEKDTNGEDADTPVNAVVLHVGDAINWTYFVRNTGILNLMDVTVTDDNGTPDDTADDFVVCPPFDLAPGQSNEDIGVTCQASGTAEQGQHGNVASVTAKDPFDNEYGGSDPSYYVAYIGTTVGDRVWHDINSNGLQDSFEADTGVDGVTVNLYDAGDQLVATTQTSNGFYSFNDLPPGDYYLAFVQPSGFEFTARDQGDDDTIDSDVDPDPASATFGRTALFTLADGEVNQDLDAGLIGEGEPATIGGYAWEDVNGDGIQNDGEASAVAVAGLSVTLYTRTSGEMFTAIGSTSTAADGSYQFTGLQAADYYLVFAKPAGYDSFTLQNKGNSEALDSDANPTNGKTALIALKAGETSVEWDVGVAKSVTIGDFVWQDANEDGIQNDDNAGLDGITVTLLDSDSNVISSTVTADGGFYLFTTNSQGNPLLPGQYQIAFTDLPAGFAFTGQDMGADDTQDSDVQANGQTAVFSVPSGSDDRTRDAGVYQDKLIIYMPIIQK